jgi:hypothetical protein
MTPQFFPLFAATFLLAFQIPVHSFSLATLSEKELRSYALTTSKGCINNVVIDEGAGPEEYCGMAIDYMHELMKRRGWSYKSLNR